MRKSWIALALIGCCAAPALAVEVVLKDAGDVAFFCSFPGHAGMMRGAISVQ